MATSDKSRRIMIDSQLRPQGVNDVAILSAFMAVPRDAYVPKGRADIAYRDRAVPLGAGRFLMAPAALGAMLVALAPRAGEKMLVVGPGADYAAALLAEIGVDAHSLDDQAGLGPARSGVTVHKGALDAGLARSGPFDAIMIVGAIDQLPDHYRDQLVDGGRLVTGLMDGGVTRLASGVRVADRLSLHPFADSQLPVLGAFAKASAFAF